MQHGTSNPEEIASVVIENFFRSEDQEFVRKIIYSQINLFQSPVGYVDWNTQLMLCLIQASDKVKENKLLNQDLPGINIGMVSAKALNYKAPARYISKELCQAFLKTPVSNFGDEITKVLPAVHIMLPRNYLFDFDGEEIISLVVHSQEKVSPEEFQVAVRKHKRILSSIPSEQVTNNFKNETTIWVCGFSKKSSVVSSYLGTNPTAKSWSKTPEQQAFNEKMGRIAINSLLVHLYEPELVSVDAKSSYQTNGFGRRKGKDPLPATWIGKTFRVQRESTLSEDGNTPRGSCRPHWRRGHWHTVVCGKGRKERKASWFRPVYVNS